MLSLQLAALESLTLWPSPSRTPFASIREAINLGCSGSIMWSFGRLTPLVQPKGRHALTWRCLRCADASAGSFDLLPDATQPSLYFSWHTTRRCHLQVLMGSWHANGRQVRPVDAELHIRQLRAAVGGADLCTDSAVLTCTAARGQHAATAMVRPGHRLRVSESPWPRRACNRWGICRYCRSAIAVALHGATGLSSAQLLDHIHQALFATLSCYSCLKAVAHVFINST